MKTVVFRLTTLLLTGILLPSCAMAPHEESAETRPMSFHDTRLQYALLTDDRQTLMREFDMAYEPSMVERVVSGFVLPFTASIETIFWPISTSIKTYLDEGNSRQGKRNQ